MYLRAEFYDILLKSIKLTNPVLVAQLLLQLSVDFLNVIQIVHCHAAVLILLAHFRAMKLLCQGFYLHLQVRDLSNTQQTTLTVNVCLIIGKSRNFSYLFG